MRIDRVELFHVQLELVHPFRTSFGLEHQRQLVLVRLFSEGLSGWGEVPVTANPGYSYETVGTAWEVLQRHFLPAIFDVELESARSLTNRWRKLRGHPMARAGVELAFWDLLGRASGRSLSEMLGGIRDRVAVGVSIGLQPDLAMLVERADSFIKQGYQRVKIKIEPGRDIELVSGLRELYPELNLQVDANAAYNLDDLELLKELDRYDLSMVEQPFAAGELLDHAKLQSAINTPVCLDESIGSEADARQALELGAARIINIKQARVGGISEAVRIHDRCHGAGVPVWCGGLLETGVGRAANLALASLPGFTLPGDISATDRYYQRDLALPEFQLEDGCIQVPNAPGLGVEVDQDRLASATLRRAVLP